MSVYRLAPIDIRANDEKWAASNLKEAVWVEAADEMAARHLVENATLRMVDFRPGRPLIFSPWLDDVVTSCHRDLEAEAVPPGHLRTQAGKLVALPAA
ncbi:hypothetical protein WN73_38430 [Bradyrhizobium sp. CCBAU 45394]|uniref:hypothetical protein n=1 Tax=Bradyrhizobium sp. CCBAU 45394 TaxID=1325087 RepID=UPI00230304A3|nr:hypothetical protein [Bradyrhizobium sp. CCBAU 45394]MDA9396393.1 hypothetical protein [Bradyrhizobium sp. CCBAU 45394]